MRVILILLITLSMTFAKSDKLSHIPPAKSLFLNTDLEVCDMYCMQELIDKGQIFTFLSHYDSSNEEYSSLRSAYSYYKRLFRVFDDAVLSIRVAVIVPQKTIRRYASTTVNSVIAYLASKQNNFEIKVFNSMDEQEHSIIKVLNEIKNENFEYVIAPVTKLGAQTIIENADYLNIYIPTVNKDVFDINKTNIVFGGIDYNKQVDELLKYANDRVAYFADGSDLSKSLNNLLIDKSPKIVYSKSISNSRVSFKRMLRHNRKLVKSSVFMNTPLVKTSLIASQLRVYGIRPYMMLSTQINYNPMLLTLTQYADRKNFYLANSIGKTTVEMEEVNSLLGHDIVYDWVNYSTSIGIDYLYTNFFVPTASRNFSEAIIDNQVAYDISIERPQRYKFEKVLF